MAEVWEGQDDVLSRPVAVKMLLPHLAADPALRERFRREAVTAARLVHPGIVAIFDAGVDVLSDHGAGPGTVLSTGWPREDVVRAPVAWPEQASTAFIVMELVAGETLKELMARAGPLPAELAVAIALQVTDALAHAHAHGLVHRDVKPANVLLSDEGPGLVRVKVADFGIALATASSNDLTASGALLGTPKYISPEQVEGREPDARADLYSLGVVMYEMLAGHVPFRASTDMATALAHVQQPVPDLGQERPDVPAPVVEVVASLLAKDPDQRARSAPELARALTSARRSMGAPPPGPGGQLQLGEAAPPPGARAQQQPGDAAVDDTLSGVDEPGRAGADGTAMFERPPDGGHRPMRTSRSVSAVVAALLIAGTGVAVALVEVGPGPAGHGRAGTGSSGQTAGPGPSTAGSQLTITSAHELTLAQRGLSPTDHLATLPNIYSAHPSGVWTSYIYKGPNFGGYDGLGIVLQVGRPGPLHHLSVTTTMSGWTAEAYVSNNDPPTLAGWGAPVSRQNDIHGSTTFPLGGRRGAWVLLWMVDPGRAREAEITRVSLS
jgi:serine/threonine protein kinase